jgi:diguanylate cyclase (GGDEF)-like protein/PAS domain S-box-containing protein
MRPEKGPESTDGIPALPPSGSDELLQNVVENAAVPTFLTGTDGRLFYANRAFGELLGYTPAEIVSLGVRKIVHPDDGAVAREQIRALAAGEIDRYDAERRYIHKDRSVIWVIVSALPVLDKRTGKPRYITVQAVDINRQKQAEAALADSEKRWNSALESAGQGVWDHDLKNSRVFFSNMWRQMRGIGPDEVIDGSREAWLARVHPDDRERVLNESLRQDSGELKKNDFEYRERHRDGHYIWILSRGKPIEWMADGSVARIIGTDTDITGLKLEEARASAEAAETYRQHLAALEKAHEATEAAHQLALSLARHDALTGLPNRRVFAEALSAELRHISENDAACAILSVDLDRFKPVNDIHGHAAGDTVLCEVASRLRDAVRESDTVARFGGDEFGVILGSGISASNVRGAAAHLAQRIIENLQRPMGVSEKQIEVGASVGIALCPVDGVDAEVLLRAADMAMYRAKEGGRGRFCFFEHSMETDLLDRAALEEDVRQAVANNDIRPYYQPLVKLAENSLVGFEILARWHHPSRGEVPPDTFIPVAERLGLIGQLTYSLLRRACLDARPWPHEITIALNVSPRHFLDPLLPVKFLAILSETNFPPSRLEVEVTESALVDDLPAAQAVLRALRDVGIKISLDDFGTGYSSLYHLRELRFDKIKIDRSFVTSMVTDVDRAKIVHSVLALAKSLGMPSIAEGVEHLETMKELIQGGAEYGQGFYFGKAVPADGANAIIRTAAAPTDSRRSA